MRRADNSNVSFCVTNLLQTFKTEVPYAREKGINHETLSLPEDEIEQQLNEDAEEVVDEYEPRVDIDDIEMESYSDEGGYKYHVSILPADEE